MVVNANSLPACSFSSSITCPMMAINTFLFSFLFIWNANRVTPIWTYSINFCPASSFSFLTSYPSYASSPFKETSSFAILQTD